MKRLSSIFVAAALVIVSCSQAGREKPKIGLAMRSFDEPISVAIRQSIETRALDKADLSIVDGQNQQSTLDLEAGSFFQKNLGSLAIDPVDGKALSPIIGKAKDARTPIVFFDREPSEEAMRSWDKLFFVGTRGAEAGEAMGQMLVSFWKDNPAADRNKDRKIQYILLSMDPDSSDTALLEASCVKALGAAGVGAERLSAEDEKAEDRPSGKEAAALIADFSERIEAVVCADSESTLEAIDAFKAAGFFKGKRYLPIVGACAGDPPQWMTDALGWGELLGVAAADAANQGKAVFDLAYALATGRNPSKAGWRITDAKYVWMPYRKLAGKPRNPSPARRK